MNSHTILALLEKAAEAMQKAYAPYSRFPVGAAIQTERGEIFPGCNIENASYPAGICAERTALFSAVAQGHLRFTHLALVGISEPFIHPCGICLQVLSEFAPDLIVYTSSLEGLKEERYNTFTLHDLMPFAFNKENLSSQ